MKLFITLTFLQFTHYKHITVEAAVRRSTPHQARYSSLINGWVSGSFRKPASALQDIVHESIDHVHGHRRPAVTITQTIYSSVLRGCNV